MRQRAYAQQRQARRGARERKRQRARQQFAAACEQADKAVSAVWFTDFIAMPRSAAVLPSSFLPFTFSLPREMAYAAAACCALRCY